jgi:hypothetical protein
MEWVDSGGSSTILKFGHDAEQSVLVIEFLNGGVYQYFDVPEEVFQKMCAADSKGRFLAQQIKGVYRYARM